MAIAAAGTGATAVLAIVSRTAPVPINSATMSVAFLSSFLATWPPAGVGAFYEPLGPLGPLEPLGLLASQWRGRGAEVRKVER